MDKRKTSGEGETATVHHISASRSASDGFLASRKLHTQLKTLGEIAIQIDAAVSFDEILHVLRMEAKWLVDHDLCFLSLLNPSRTHYVIHALSSLPDRTGLHRRQFSLHQGLPGLAIQIQVPVFSTFSDAPTFSDAVEGVLVNHGMQSIIAVPLRTADMTLGSVTFSSRTRLSYDEQSTWIAQLLANCVAIALRNTTLFDDARRRISQIELVNHIARELISTLDLQELLASATASIKRVFNYHNVSILMATTSEFVLVAHSGDHGKELAIGQTHKKGEGIIGWVASHGKKILANDTLLDRRYSPFIDRQTRSQLAIPIINDREVVGVLSIEDLRVNAFDTTDAIVLETLCDQLASAIKNARLYEEVRKANVKLTELDRMKSDFISIVSHDFRSPLASIVLAAKGAIQPGEPVSKNRIQDHLKIIIEQATRLTHLAEDTLSTTKMESGKVSYQFEPLNTQSLIDEASSLVTLSRLHRVHSTVERGAQFVLGDEAKIRQVLHNLISNAVKYSPRGGTITIKTRLKSPGMAIISVTDDGVGIPANQVSKLFQKFSRVTQESTHRIKGSGLGLWISREIVRAHGGDIWVESAVGQGSCFFFTIPVADSLQTRTG